MLTIWISYFLVDVSVFYIMFTAMSTTIFTCLTYLYIPYVSR